MRASLLTVSGLALSGTAVGQVLQWDIEKRHDLPDVRRRGLSRRADDSVLVSIKNDLMEGGYFATVNIGSPGQQLNLQLDTGSSDLWVLWQKSKACIDGGENNSGCSQGSFNPDDSDTFTDVGQGEFQARYADGSFVEGDYFQDVLGISGISIQNMTMGLGIDTDITIGLLGVGYQSDEGLAATTGATYPNLPLALQQAGMIKSAAFSLWLNDLDAGSGTVLFGGIDTERFVGDLTKIPILQDERVHAFTAFMVSLTSVEADSTTGHDILSQSENIPSVFDSGTTLSYLPQDLAESLWNEVGAEYNSRFGLATVDCAMASVPGQILLGFDGPNGPKINVSMNELVIQLTSGGTTIDGLSKGQSTCAFGIQNTSSAPALIGDSVLRSAYVVYDLVNNEIGLAATNFNASSSNVVPFSSEGAPIPSATAAPSGSAPTIVPSTNSGLAAAQGFKAGHGNGQDSAGAVLCTFPLASIVIFCITMVFTLFQSI